MPDITKETYMQADEHTQKGIMFDLISGLHNKLDAQIGEYEDRFKCLEKAKKRNTAYATMGGFGGGIIAFIAQWLMRR